MRIKLDDKHWLNSDPYCYWISVEIQPTAKSKSQNVYERRCSGYTATFEDCVDSYINKYIKQAEIGDFKTLKKEITNLKKEVRSWKAKVERA